MTRHFGYLKRVIVTPAVYPLVLISSLCHSEHWAEITLCQHHFPIVRSSSELSVHRTRKASRSIPCPSIVTKRESTRHREASSSFRAAQILTQGPLHPLLRANPFTEVTDLFCRLPLPTLFCGPEAANLGDLMRLWVRSGVQINLSFGFSRAVGSASDTSNEKVLYQPINPIARQSDFKDKKSC